MGNVLSIWKEQWIIWNAQTNKLVQGILARSGKLDVHYAVDYSNKSSCTILLSFEYKENANNDFRFLLQHSNVVWEKLIGLK
jgi:hypothetical protein